MRPQTVASGRKPISGFYGKKNNVQGPSKLSKTRPLKRPQSWKAATILTKSDYSILLPSSLKMQNLTPKARLYFKTCVAPVQQVNAFPLFQALQCTAQDSLELSGLAVSASNLHFRSTNSSAFKHRIQRKQVTEKTLRQNSGFSQTTPERRPVGTRNSSERRNEGQEEQRDLVRLIREFAVKRAVTAQSQENEAIQVVPTSAPRQIIRRVGKGRSSVSTPDATPHSTIQSAERMYQPMESWSRALQTDDSGLTPTPKYTLMTQYIEQLVPVQSQEELKRKLRGRLVRISA